MKNLHIGTYIHTQSCTSTVHLYAHHLHVLHCISWLCPNKNDVGFDVAVYRTHKREQHNYCTFQAFQAFLLTAQQNHIFVTVQCPWTETPISASQTGHKQLFYSLSLPPSLSLSLSSPPVSQPDKSSQSYIVSRICVYVEQFAVSIEINRSLG